MKRKISTLLLMSFMLIISLTLRAQTKLITSYGWEPAETSPHWWTGNATTGTLTVVNEPSNARTGNGALKFVVATKPANAWDNQVGFDNMPVDSNSIYRFSVWAKGELPAGTTGTYANINVTGGVYQTWAGIGQQKYGVGLTDTYQKFTIMVSIADASLLPANGTTNNVIRYPIHFGEVGTYYLDDMVFTKSHLSSAVIDGDSLTLDFGWILDSTSFFNNTSVLTVKVGPLATAVTNPVTAYKVVPKTGILQVKLTNSVNPGDSVKVSYSNSNNDLAYDGANNGNTEPTSFSSFVNEVVENVTTTTGMKEVFAARARVYPNPVTDYVQLQCTYEVKSVEIISASGRIVKSYNTNEKVFNLSDLNRGLYLLKITHSAGVDVLKIMKN
ncbi:MAG: T9SS type A sorting domain-containing protein [Bacteroidales bacterium]